MLLALGALISATYAAPASSEIQQDEDDSGDLIAAIEKLSKVTAQDEDDDSDLIAAIENVSEVAAQDDDDRSDDTLAEAELFKKLFRKAKKLFGKRSWLKKWKGGRRYVTSVLGGYGGGYPRRHPRRYPGRYPGCPIRYDNAKVNEQGIDLDQDSDVMAAIEGLPEKAQAQIFSFIRKLWTKKQGIDLDQDADVMAAIEGLPEKAQAQIFSFVRRLWTN